MEIPGGDARARSPVIQCVLDFDPHFGQGCHGVGAHTELHTNDIELLAG